MKREINYLDKLRLATKTYGSITCMGLDPVLKALHKRFAYLGIIGFLEMLQQLFTYMKSQHVYPGAFKPNFGFYEKYNHARDGDFIGLETLGQVMNLIEKEFPDMPIILDYKRGDIGKSSTNYAEVGFKVWDSHAITISPYMGTDSMLPFAEYCGLQPSLAENRGVYILNLTSNPGAKDFEMLDTVDGKKVYLKISEWILAHAGKYPGLGAVIGAPNIEGLRDIGRLYAESIYSVPPLIPGVGGQGGKFDEVVSTLQDVGYEKGIIRINVSSGLTHPWGENKPAPDDWYKVIVDKLFEYNKISGLA